MDKKAKRIVSKTFRNNGWIDDENRRIDASDFAYAKEKSFLKVEGNLVMGNKIRLSLIK
ncbi:hypothetical protein [Lactobacillus xylocopicola]|uniref:Uncharacterized protein n=1 Tax=Lactobacillus xylocopicola TaxID=2976676 RepID=A0ABM8BH56_9LACO|nr:hypothetical protein [Lactobacillus xylocopicola]BDR60612.1 hypothetical protein KIM322_08730 [Lactobacillus xylocopicola]